ncbi:hypothetical protein FHG87_010786 [Trinorchestia longiramus]|nr:hypothetical protein FHG87_010786 [Trinorchestia longiramus]
MWKKLLAIIISGLLIWARYVKAQGSTLITLAHLLQGLDPSGPPRLIQDHHTDAYLFDDFADRDSPELEEK